MDDLVNHPPHYTNSDQGLECIDALRASMSYDEYCGYLKGNVFKYLWRYRHKEKPLQDLRKARWYLDRLICELDVDEEADEPDFMTFVGPFDDPVSIPCDTSSLCESMSRIKHRPL